MPYLFRSDLKNQKLPVVDVPLKKHMMCLNESVHDPFRLLLDKFLEKMEEVHINRYFSGVTSQLEKTLAEYVGHGVTPEHLAYGNGADQMLHTLFTAVREDKNSFAVSAAPSYFDYRTYARAVGMDVKFVPMDREQGFAFDLGKYLELSRDDNCKLLILCNPNNPTGHLLPPELIQRVLESTTKPVLIDETYFEFSGVTWADRLNDYPHLIIIRSFSKAFSAAGLRFGYMISRPENIHEIKKVMTFFHMSLFVAAMTLTILENRDVFQQITRQTIADRDALLEKMQDIAGVTVYPTSTNFLVFTVGERTREMYEYMTQRDIALRWVGAHPTLADHVRVSIGSEDDNRAFLNALRQWISS